MSTILIVDDEPSFRALVRDIVETRGHRAVEAADGVEALEKLGRMRVDAVIADQRMPRMRGTELLRKIRDMAAPPPVLMLTAHGTIPEAVEAVRLGAFDYLTKPLDSPAALLAVLERALGGDDKSSEIVAESARMRALLDTADRVAAKDVSVLITGESGTGKEVLARRIHQRSQRARAAFVGVNCAALPETLAESELFGHERGAFTGAERQRAGRFEEAHGGTLFLDEIGDLPLSIQAKLLRALEEHVIRRVGGTRDLPVDVRIIAATNHDLSAAVEQGGFRSDLFFRLAVVQLEIPPLRERIDEIPQLARHLLHTLAHRHGHGHATLTDDALTALRAYDWPGNIRELRNTIERAVVIRGDAPIRAEDLSLSRAAAPARTVEQAEREATLDALRRSDGNRDTAAKLLGISVRTLYYRLRKLGLT